MVQLRVDDSRMRRVQLGGIRRAYVVENADLEGLLFDRNLVGLDFTAACEAASVHFVFHARDELVADPEDVGELMILAKSLYYFLHRAYAQVIGHNLQANLVATRRTEVQGTAVRSEVIYTSFDAGARTLLIGDTVASGETVCAALEQYLQVWELERVYLFTFAGSIVGGRRIDQYCQSRSIELTILYGLAAFGLGANGFDLSFLHPDTVTRREYRERASDRYLGRAVSAVGWDFGSQAQAPRKYRNLCWMEAARWGLQSTDVFRLAERPVDWTLIDKERPAWEK